MPSHGDSPADRIEPTDHQPDPGLGEIADLKGRFDAEFYLATNPEVARQGVDPLVHYWTVGWREGRDPSPDFSTSGYLAAHPDVAASEFNPFWHYIKIGRDEGRICHPSELTREVESPPAISPGGEPDKARELIGRSLDLRGHFDADFYLQNYPELAGLSIDPLLHYWSVGWTEGRDPNPDFSTSYYLEANKDVAESDFHPFWHYLMLGREEGRAPRPPAHEPGGDLFGSPEEIADEFDAAFYRLTCPEVAESGVDPLTHYWTVGWKKGYDPNPSFSTSLYLLAYPDVAESDFHPFWHYVMIGREEGRLPRPSG